MKPSEKEKLKIATAAPVEFDGDEEAGANNVEVEDIQELLSNELTKLAILQKNTIITVKLDYEELLFRVVRLEPASVVLCEGDEVELEFYEEAVPTPVERPVAINPTPEPVPEVPAPVRFNPWRNKDFKPYMS